MTRKEVGRDEKENGANADAGEAKEKRWSGDGDVVHIISLGAKGAISSTMALMAANGEAE